MSLLFVLSFILTACGGGGGGGSSSDVRVSLNLNFEDSRAASDGFYVSNTKISSVSLAYTNNQGSAGAVNVTSDASDGSVQLTNLVLDTTYTFTVTAVSDEGINACTGSTSVLIASGSTNQANLECTFIDSLAIENAVYDFIAKLASSNPTAEALDKYVADDFGIMDGMTRSEFIDDIINDNDFDFAGTGVTFEKVDVITGSTRAAGTEAQLSFFFSDGTVFRERANLIKENGHWKITGNGRKYETEMYAEAFNVIPSGHSSEVEGFYSGISTQFYDSKSVAESVIVSGPTMPYNYTFSANTCSGCDGFELSDPYIDDLPSFFSHHFINLYGDGTNAIVSNNQTYNILTYYYDNTETESDYIVFGSPVPVSNLTTGHFPMLPAGTSQNIADYIVSTNYTFNIIKPTAYDAERINVWVSYNDYYGTYGDIELSVPLNADTITLDFSELDGLYVTNADIFLSAYDSSGQVYTTVIELYYDSSTATPSSTGYTALADTLSSMTSSQVSTLANIFSYATDSNVRAALVSISEGTSAGLSSSDVSAAYADALLRINPYSDGSPEYVAYNALVDSFASLLVSNSGAASMISSFASTLSSTGLSAFSTLVTVADDEGFAVYAEVFTNNIDDIIAEVEAGTGGTIVVPNEISENLTKIAVTNGSGSYSGYTEAGFFSDGRLVSCNSSEVSASIFVEGDTENSFYEFKSTESNPIQACGEFVAIEDSTSDYYGSSYLVGQTSGEVVQLVFFDETGSIEWTKTITPVGDPRRVADAVIVNGENLLILMTDNAQAYGYLLEINTAGEIVTNKKITAVVSQSLTNIAVTYKRVVVDDNNHYIAIVGQGHVDGIDFANPIILLGTYTYNEVTTTFTFIYGGLPDVNTEPYDANHGMFEDVVLQEDGILAVGKVVNTDNMSSLLISKFWFDMETFSNSVFAFDTNNNYFLARVVYANDTSSYYVSVVSDAGPSEIVKFSLDSTLRDSIPASSEVYTFEAFNRIDLDMDLAINNIYTDNAGHVMFLGSLSHYLLGEYILVGAMKSSDLTINGSLVASSALEPISHNEALESPAEYELTITVEPEMGYTLLDKSATTYMEDFLTANPAMEVVLTVLQ